MTRHQRVPYEELDPAQRRVHDIISTGLRGSVSGPFDALLLSPELCDRVQELGLFIRFENSLPGRLRELAILVTARHWTAQYEWYAHSQIARLEGLDDDVIEAIRIRNAEHLDDPVLQTIRHFTTSLLTTGEVPDSVHAQVVKLVGDRGVADLVGTIGYYCLISLTLNAFDVPLPEGVAPPLER